MNGKVVTLVQDKSDNIETHTCNFLSNLTRVTVELWPPSDQLPFVS